MIEEKILFKDECSALFPSSFPFFLFVVGNGVTL